MIAFKQSCRGKRLRCALSLLIALIAAGLGGNQATADTFAVVMDRAKVLKIPERTTTVVVGNPLIADISVQAGGMIVVTGKGYGVTNLIALDTRGNTLMEQVIEVQGPKEHVVVMYRGVERESYSCTPNCERRITLGDTAPFFESTLLQTGRRDGQAQGSSGAR